MRRATWVLATALLLAACDGDSASGGGDGGTFLPDGAGGAPDALADSGAGPGTDVGAPPTDVGAADTPAPAPDVAPTDTPAPPPDVHPVDVPAPAPDVAPDVPAPDVAPDVPLGSLRAGESCTDNAQCADEGAICVSGQYTRAHCNPQCTTVQDCLDAAPEAVNPQCAAIGGYQICIWFCGMLGGSCPGDLVCDGASCG